MPFDDSARITGSDDHRSSAVTRRRWLELLGLTGVTGLAGCSGGGETADGGGTPAASPTETDSGFGERTETAEPTEGGGDLPEVGGAYVDVISSEIATVNVVYNTENTAGGIIALAKHGAYGFRPGQQLFPLLMDLRTDDNQVWVADVRDNLQWSDPYGEVTAEDFVYLIQEVHQSDWAGSAASPDWFVNEEPIPVEQTGTYEWQIELPEADPLFPKKPVTWGMEVIPMEIAETYVQSEDAEGFQEDEELLDLSYAGNLGPYTLENWERQSRFTFSRNDEYFMRELAEDDGSDVPRAWANAPYFEELTVQIITEPSARVGAIETGEVDEVGLEPSQAVNLEGTDGLYINQAPQPYNTPVFYNMRANGWEPFRRQGVRQALGCAVDKETYVEGVQRGYADPAYTWQPEWSPWYTDAVDENVERYGTGDLYGPEVTRDRLGDALSDTVYEYDGETLVDGNGDPVELRLMYQAGQAVEERTAEFLQQEFDQNAGIQLNIEAVQPNTFVADYWQQQIPENADELEWSEGAYNAGPRDEATSNEPWDIGLIFGLNTYPMTPDTSMIFFQRDSFYNPYGYYPEWDAKSVAQQMAEATTEAEYQEAVTTMLVEVSRDQPMGMLSLGAELTAYRDAVQGPQEEFFNGWNFATWHKE